MFALLVKIVLLDVLHLIILFIATMTYFEQPFIILNYYLLKY
jgi:hypothetical protein